MHECWSQIMVNSATAKLYQFPPNVGLPIGESGLEYLLLEIHYKFHVPPGEATDSSGVVIRYTSPRQIEAGDTF